MEKIKVEKDSVEEVAFERFNYGYEILSKKREK